MPWVFHFFLRVMMGDIFMDNHIFENKFFAQWISFSFGSIIVRLRLWSFFSPLWFKNTGLLNILSTTSIHLHNILSNLILFPLLLTSWKKTQHCFILPHNKKAWQTQCFLFRSELCCNHCQSDDLIPLNTALLQVPCGSTKELGARDGVNWRLNAAALS